MEKCIQMLSELSEEETRLFMEVLEPGNSERMADILIGVPDETTRKFLEIIKAGYAACNKK